VIVATGAGGQAELRQRQPVERTGTHATDPGYDAVR
jgi:hypothetical protein